MVANFQRLPALTADGAVARPFRGVRRRPVALDLFCGVGGMSLGFEQAGFDVVACADLDPIHLAAHARNFPLAEPLCADARELSRRDLEAAIVRGWARRYPSRPAPAEVDCIFGGPSCQGFSIIGPRDPGDARNELILHFARLVAEVKPRFFVMENVPGLVSVGYRAALAAFYAQMGAAGYAVDKPWLLNARDHGVPQERRRVFIVGAREGERLPRRPSQAGEPIAARQALDDLPAFSRFASLWTSDVLRLDCQQLATMIARRSEYVRRLNATPASPENLSDARRWDAAELTGVGLTSHATHVQARFRRLAPGERDAVGRLPKLDPNAPSPTLRAGTGRDHGSFTSVRPIHYRSPRVITIREAARLHGLPDWFGLHATKWHGLRQIGNSVPPPLARTVAGTIVEAAGLVPGRRSGAAVELGERDMLRLDMEQAATRFALHPSRLPVNVRAVARSAA